MQTNTDSLSLTRLLYWFSESFILKGSIQHHLWGLTRAIFDIPLARSNTHNSATHRPLTRTLWQHETPCCYSRLFLHLVEHKWVKRSGIAECHTPTRCQRPADAGTCFVARLLS